MLKKSEIFRVVNDFIGVSGGYLRNFSYRTHYEFYPYYCDLEIDVGNYEPGTTREKFIRILEDATPADQAKILRGVLKKFPEKPDETGARAEARLDVLEMIKRLEAQGLVGSPELAKSPEAVEEALRDAEALLETRGPRSAVDRVHTALHGYLGGLCEEVDIEPDDGASVDTLFRRLRDEHPALRGVGSTHVVKVYRGMAQAINGLSPARNRESLAHPTESLLDEDDAQLVVNSVRTMLHYLEAKVRGWRGDT